jgi:carbamate kinase
MALPRRAVVAIGGNALIRPDERGTIDEQFANARRVAERIAALTVHHGWQVVVTHGNGPQVGFILLRSEMAPTNIFTPRLKLDMCDADSQGSIGYILSNSISAELARLGSVDRVACVLTQTVVDPADPAFEHPTKPIGSAYSESDARQLHSTRGWQLAEDAGRGYRRLVASPRPRRIVELEAIRLLLESGLVVVAAGGGGIPVVETELGVYRGVEAVIDKDLASALLASGLRVPVLVITTGVDRVAVHYHQPDQRFLDRVTLDEARQFVAAGEFPEGSMAPKMRAAIEFLEAGGREVIITSLECLESAVAGAAGTHIVP